MSNIISFSTTIRRVFEGVTAGVDGGVIVVLLEMGASADLTMSSNFVINPFTSPRFVYKPFKNLLEIFFKLSNSSFFYCQRGRWE